MTETTVAQDKETRLVQACKDFYEKHLHLWGALESPDLAVLAATLRRGLEVRLRTQSGHVEIRIFPDFRLQVLSGRRECHEVSGHLTRYLSERGLLDQPEKKVPQTVPFYDESVSIDRRK